MKSNAMTGLLVGLLFVSAFACVVQVLRVTFARRDLRRTQAQVLQINARMTVAQSLLNDTVEYSKRNPAINPLLESLKLKTNSDPATIKPGPAAK
jgi:hypothetical protein